LLTVEALYEKGRFKLSNYLYNLGNPFLAASVSISISLVVVLGLWLAWSKAEGDFTQFNVMPWWVIVSTIIDQIGAFGLEVKPINTMKIIGLGLVILGAGLVQYSNS